MYQVGERCYFSRLKTDSDCSSLLQGDSETVGIKCGVKDTCTFYSSQVNYIVLLLHCVAQKASNDV